MKKITLFLSANLLFIIPVFARAQQSKRSNAGQQQTGEGIEKRSNEFGIWGSVSFDATTWIGYTPDARFGNVGLRYGRVLAASKTVALEWTVDAIPVAILSNSRVFSVSPFIVQRKSVYAWGISPIGLKVNFRRNKRVQPFGASTGGFLYFNEQVPVSGAARFNFTFDFQGGLQIVNGNQRSFMIGYKYNHFSNGHRAPINPGVDVQMVFFGFSIFR